MLGLGAVVGLPSIVYLIAFYKEHLQRESFNSNEISLKNLAQHITSEHERAKLKETVSYLLKKLKKKSLSDAAGSEAVKLRVRSLSELETRERPGGRRFHSFSEFVSITGCCHA